MILGVSGHREIGNEVSIKNAEYIRVEVEAEKIITQLNPTKIISGMALGFDTLIVDLCLKLNIPYIAAVPFRGQEKGWSKEIQKKYFNLLEKAQETIIICEGDYAPWKFQRRNEYIVDNCNEMLFYLLENKGGTFNCYNYAEKQKKISYRITK